ncbi:hypothetical protein MMC07_006190 [Pseudocyphellaria aurata]|nr:hypothetical protein [Pseudocyphellaria aurata]
MAKKDKKGARKASEPLDRNPAHDFEPVEQRKEAVDNMSSRSSDTFDVDTPQASQGESISENRITLNEDSNRDTLECEYLTPIVHVYLGSEHTLFLVHKGVLAQSSCLVSKCDQSGWNEILRLPEVQPQLFVLLLTYLYKGDYGTTSAEPAVKEPRNDVAAQFKTHAKVYCLASAYKLDPLVEKTIKKMEALDGIGFHSMVEIAREVYPNTQADDTWFKNYFKNEVTKALTESPDIAEDRCILDIYKHDGGRLAVDLFTTIIQFAKYGPKDEETIASPGVSVKPVPNSDHVLRCKNRAKHMMVLKRNPSWNGCRACRHEWDQMINVGQTVISVAINDLLPAIKSGRAVDRTNNATAETGTKTKEIQAKKALKTLASEIIPPILSDRTLEDCTSQCPSQAKHLKEKEGRWGWEDCPRCLEDRAQILHKLQLLDPSPSLSVLSSLIQQWQETPIPLRSAGAIVPDATSQEIAPVEVDISMGDDPGVDALEIDPAVVESSPASALPEAIRDVSVSCPQTTIPVNLDGLAVVAIQSEVPALFTLDDSANSYSYDEPKNYSPRARRMPSGDAVTEPTPMVDPKKAVSVEHRNQVFDGTWDGSGKEKNQRQPAVDWDSFLCAEDEIPPAEEQEQTREDEWGAFPLCASPPNQPPQPSDQPGTQALHTDDSWGSKAFRKKKKTPKNSSRGTFDLSRDPTVPQEPGETSLDPSLPAEDSRPKIWSKGMEVHPDSLGSGGRTEDMSKAEKLEQPKDSRDFWGSSKKKLSTADEPEQPKTDHPWGPFKMNTAVPVKDDAYDHWGISKKKKPIPDEPEQNKDDIWGSWGFSKKKTPIPEETQQVDWGSAVFSSPKTRTPDDLWDSWDVSKPKKHEPAIVETDWGLGLSSKPKKNSKRSSKRCAKTSKGADEAESDPVVRLKTWPVAPLLEPDLDPMLETPAAFAPPPSSDLDPRLKARFAEPPYAGSGPEPCSTPPPEPYFGDDPAAIPSALDETSIDPDPVVQESHCPSRMMHLVDETQWSNCVPCRRELNGIAQRLVWGSMS